ncbi:MAG: preprotein translocase subunit YajC [Candidatus Eisenbacteria bacterium]|nr:preprotein translocase subunit YajC [Candidatus Eisenbacteria bacterium]
MMEHWLVGIAEAQAPAGGRGAGGGSSQFVSTLFILGSFILIFYFLLIRPQQKRQREMQKMLGALKRGDRVLTSGGLYGTVWDVKDDLVVLKLTEELKVEVAKSAVQAVVAPTR